MTLRNRLAKLEQHFPPHQCPACAGRKGLIVLIDEGDPEPAVCEVCGVLPEKLVIVVREEEYTGGD